MKEIPRGTPEIEAVWHALSTRGARTVAVISAEPGEGVSMVALALARRAAEAAQRDGKGALLVDTNLRRPGLASLAAPAAGEMASIGGGLHLLTAPAPGSEQAWRERDGLADLAGNWLKEHATVVFDAAPALSRDAEPVPGPTVAAAAEAVILVSLSGANPANRVSEAVSVLSRSGARVAGVIMNDWRDPPLLLELERETRRLDRFLPRIADLLRGRLHRSSLLGVRV